jgi:hypothetical protein
MHAQSNTRSAAHVAACFIGDACDRMLRNGHGTYRRCVAYTQPVCRLAVTGAPAGRFSPYVRGASGTASANSGSTVEEFRLQADYRRRDLRDVMASSLRCTMGTARTLRALT